MGGFGLDGEVEGIFQNMAMTNHLHVVTEKKKKECASLE